MAWVIYYHNHGRYGESYYEYNHDGDYEKNEGGTNDNNNNQNIGINQEKNLSDGNMKTDASGFSNNGSLSGGKDQEYDEKVANLSTIAKGTGL